MYIYLHICMHTCTYTYIHMYVYIYIYVFCAIASREMSRKQKYRWSDWISTFGMHLFLNVWYAPVCAPPRSLRDDFPRLRDDVSQRRRKGVVLSCAEECSSLDGWAETGNQDAERCTKAPAECGCMARHSTMYHARIISGRFLNSKFVETAKT